MEENLNTNERYIFVLCKDLSLGLILDVGGHQLSPKLSRVGQSYGFRRISSENETFPKYLVQVGKHMLKPFFLNSWKNCPNSKSEFI